MKLTKNELRSFALTELNSYDLSKLRIKTDLALSEIEEELNEELEDLNSMETKVARMDYFKVENAKADDYAERILKLENNKKVIYGIRNKGGNPKIPFIQLRANFQITTKKESLEIYKLIEREFELFNPLYLSFHTRKKIDADFFGSVYMVAGVDKVSSISTWPRECEISFEDINDHSYYDWYKEGYDDFHRDNPELKHKVTLNSCDSMDDSLDQGLLKYVLLNEKRIGLIAGEESDFLGSTGVYFHEIFISKDWKRQGLAKVIQRKFIQSFCGELEYVWGTIDYNNQPSYKTAHSNGRRPIRYESFIKL